MGFISRIKHILSAGAAAAVVADTVTAVAPAGGTGAAAGGWDTAANRNIAITTINETKALAEANKVAINLILNSMK